jgi:NAD(P)-dependent dehydrogenase (short-subunit alcohol dehydrogenase family)
MFQPDLLAGKRVLITGSTGLGKSMERRFPELGAALAICGRREGVREEAARARRGDRRRGHDAGLRRARRGRGRGDHRAAVRGASARHPGQQCGRQLSRPQRGAARAVDAVLGIALKGSVNWMLACGRRWLAGRRPGSVLSITTTYALDRLRLRAALGDRRRACSP